MQRWGCGTIHFSTNTPSRTYIPAFTDVTTKPMHPTHGHRIHVRIGVGFAFFFFGILSIKQLHSKFQEFSWNYIYFRGFHTGVFVGTTFPLVFAQEEDRKLLVVFRFFDRHFLKAGRRKIHQKISCFTFYRQPNVNDQMRHLFWIIYLQDELLHYVKLCDESSTLRRATNTHSCSSLGSLLNALMQLLFHRACVCSIEYSMNSRIMWQPCLLALVSLSALTYSTLLGSGPLIAGNICF